MKNNHLARQKGFTLIELLVVIGIFTVLLGIIFSAYSMVLKNMSTTTKMVKTESDIVNVVWPIFKDIESAGFGIPLGGVRSDSGATPVQACVADNTIDPVKLTGARLVIHSTAAGDQALAGRWTSIGAGCSVDTNAVPNGQTVVIIDPAPRKRVASAAVAGGVLTGCDSRWITLLGYRVPTGTGLPLECYETAFELRAYTAGTRPPICQAATQQFSRSSVTAADTILFQPMLDCVLNVAYRFGCVSKETGALSWRNDPTCAAAEGSLRSVRVSIILQESPPQEGVTSPATLTMFRDLGATLQQVQNLDANQRLFKWRVIERTIALRNLE